MKVVLALAAAASLAMADPSQAAEVCSTAQPSSARVVEMQTELFGSLQREDHTAWSRLTTSDFRAFERGETYDGSGFFGLVVGAHQAGMKLNWSVTDPRVEADCNLAVMSYVNSGSITAAGQEPMPTRWLETVAFRRDPAGWRAFLVTSMRVETAPSAPAPAPHS